MRQEISVQANPFFFYGSDSTGVRGIMRLSFGFPHAPAVVKITSTPPGS
jgi:hypothetical protein